MQTQTMDNGAMKILISFSLLLISFICYLTPLIAQVTLSTSVSKESVYSLDIVILNAIAKKLKAKLIIQHAPFQRRLYMMQDGTIDIIAGLLKRPEREEYIHFVQPPYKERSDTIFFVPKGKSSLIQKYEDLSALKIGTTFGAKYFHKFDKDNELYKEPVPKVTSNFQKLLLGRLDTVIYPEGDGIEKIHEMGIADKIDIAQYRFSKKKQVYIGISKKSHMIDDVSGTEFAIRQMIEDGEIKQIIIDHYTQRNLPVPAH